MTCAKHKSTRSYCEACSMSVTPKTLAEPVASQARGPKPGAQADATAKTAHTSMPTSARPSPSPAVASSAGEGAAEGAKGPREAALAALVATVFDWPPEAIALLTEAAKLGQPMRAVATRKGSGKSLPTGPDSEHEWHQDESPIIRAAVDLDHAFRQLNIAVHPWKKPQ